MTTTEDVHGIGAPAHGANPRDVGRPSPGEAGEPRT